MQFLFFPPHKNAITLTQKCNLYIKNANLNEHKSSAHPHPHRQKCNFRTKMPPQLFTHTRHMQFLFFSLKNRTVLDLSHLLPMLNVLHQNS